MGNLDVRGQNFVEQNQNEVSEQNPNPEKSEQPKESIEDVARKLGDARLALEEAQKQLTGPEGGIGKLLHKLKGEQSRIDAQAKVDSLTSQISRLEAQGAELEKINGIVDGAFRNPLNEALVDIGKYDGHVWVEKISYVSGDEIRRREFGTVEKIKMNVFDLSKKTADELRDNPDALAETMLKFEQENEEPVDLISPDVKVSLMEGRNDYFVDKYGKLNEETGEKTMDLTDLKDEDASNEIGNRGMGISTALDSWEKNRSKSDISKALDTFGDVSTLVENCNNLIKKGDILKRMHTLDAIVLSQLPKNKDKITARDDSSVQYGEERRKIDNLLRNIEFFLRQAERLDKFIKGNS